MFKEADKARTGNVFADLTLGYFRNRKKLKEKEEAKKAKEEQESNETDINSEASAKRYKNDDKKSDKTDINSAASVEQYKNDDKKSDKKKDQNDSSKGFDKDENKIGHYVNFKQLLRPGNIFKAAKLIPSAIKAAKTGNGEQFFEQAKKSKVKGINWKALQPEDLDQYLNLDNFGPTKGGRGGSAALPSLNEGKKSTFAGGERTFNRNDAGKTDVNRPLSVKGSQR
jgi:hypothetical protein